MKIKRDLEVLHTGLQVSFSVILDWLSCLYEIDGREETEASLPLYKEELIYVQAIYRQNQPTDNIKVT